MAAKAFSTTSVAESLLGDVVVGMIQSPKNEKFIPTHHLYNPVGSLLYNELSRHPTYYVRVAEEQLLEDFNLMLPLLASFADFQSLYVASLGPGSGHKDALLLKHLIHAMGISCIFNPIDVSPSACVASSEFVLDYLQSPICTVDPRSNGQKFVDGLHASRGVQSPRLITYLGSTFGNFAFPQNLRHLQGIVGEMYADDFLLIGMDMQHESKPISVIEAAYNNVPTIEWVLNLLDWINQKLGTRFNRTDFDYLAFFDESLPGIRTSLVANKTMEIPIPNTEHVIRFDDGEELHVEVSVKYKMEQLESLLRQAGLEIVQCVEHPMYHYNLYLLRTLR